ncbi:MAG: winged helix-turn-helix domain-containing protein [Aeriscardovia sp.]|nr:winged helix-turn-helix domain-containing protein [Aeriscardovia sp.]
MLKAIADNPKITIVQMAAQSGVTSRTVQRYLKVFQMMVS